MHDAIATLRRYSLVDATPEFISVHRLVQLVVRDRLKPEEYRSFHEIADRLEHGPFDSSVEVVLEGARPQSEGLSAKTTPLIQHEHTIETDGGEGLLGKSFPIMPPYIALYYCQKD
jgi:hypothetical protein